jgi:septum formation protein
LGVDFVLNVPMKLHLASKSPRRKQLLEEHGFEVIVHPVEFVEVVDPGLPIDEGLMALARHKAETCLREIGVDDVAGLPLIAADTVVVVEGTILGKPVDARQATEFLNRLKARCHEVKTAVCVHGPPPAGTVTFCETTRVCFRDLTAQEIERYVATGEPFDKAGGYGVQGAARAFVSRLDGSLSNVVGLPMERLLNILKANANDVDRR